MSLVTVRAKFLDSASENQPQADLGADQDHIPIGRERIPEPQTVVLFSGDEVFPPDLRVRTPWS